MCLCSPHTKIPGWLPWAWFDKLWGQLTRMIWSCQSFEPSRHWCLRLGNFLWWDTPFLIFSFSLQPRKIEWWDWEPEWWLSHHTEKMKRSQSVPQQGHPLDTCSESSCKDHTWRKPRSRVDQSPKSETVPQSKAWVWRIWRQIWSYAKEEWAVYSEKYIEFVGRCCCEVAVPIGPHLDEWDRIIIFIDLRESLLRSLVAFWSLEFWLHPSLHKYSQTSISKYNINLPQPMKSWH